MLEEKLAATDTAIDNAARNAREIGTIIKSLRRASAIGDLGQLHRHMSELNNRVDRLREIYKVGWLP